MSERELPAQIKRMHSRYSMLARHTCSECERFLDKGKSHLCELFQEETKLDAVWRGDWPACGMWEVKR